MFWLMRKKPLTPEQAAQRMLEPGENVLWLGIPQREWWLIPAHLMIFLIPAFLLIYFTLAEFFEWSFHAPIMVYISLVFITIIAFNAVIAAKKMAVYVITDRRILIRRSSDKYVFSAWEYVESISFQPISGNVGNIKFRINQNGKKSAMRFKAVGPLDEIENLLRPFYK